MSSARSPASGSVCCSGSVCWAWSFCSSASAASSSAAASAWRFWFRLWASSCSLERRLSPLVPLAAQAVGAGAELVQLLAEGGGLVQALAQGFLSGFQLRDLAGFVEPPAVEPGFQTVVGLGKNEMSSSPVETRAVIFFSSSWLWLTARSVCLRKSRAVKDLLAQAVSSSPAVSAVIPSTGRPVSCQRAENSPIGTPPAEVRRSSKRFPSCSQTSSPSMGAPFQGR